ncbi:MULTISPECIES: hypothetical protein [Sphingomonas]|uniref:hypothetical protein n=1 Tax=Sphingomonas TaxID=13687 RepID=UPI000DF018CC|nr:MULTISPECIES: hypothetical protein [Sphingomonas]
MRRTAILTLSALTAALVGACAYNEAPQPRSPQALQELDRYLAGKVAGPPQSCLPNYRANDMVVIDEHTVLFRDGRRVWRTEIPGGCSNLGRPGYAMVTKQFGGEGLCRGQIVQVVDTASGMVAGGCTFGDFVPFEAPRPR